MSQSLNPPRIAPWRWILLTVLTFITAGASSWSLLSGLRVPSWTPTKARIVASEVVTDSDGLEKLAVRYEYFVAGQRDWNAGFLDGVSKKEWANYAPGREVTCFVNPKDPSQALLRRDMELIHWFLPVILLAIGGGLAYGAKRALTQQRIAETATLFTLETAVTTRRSGRKVA